MASHHMLKYYLDDEGNRVYTLNHKDPNENVTHAGHPGILLST